MRVVAISGSLRARSSNAAVLRAAQAVRPAGVELLVYEGLSALPYFNPDLDGEGSVPPAEVAELRARLAAAGAVLLCSPEYAHGVPGALKNALDWLVSATALIGKPVAVITVAPSGGHHAHAQLCHTLETMSWRVIEAAGARLTIGRAQLDAQGEVADAAVLNELRGRVGALADAAAALTARG